jgi:hypothetical protein
MYKSHNPILIPGAYPLRSGGRAPVVRPSLPSTIIGPLSRLGGPHGSGHPDPDFTAAPRQHNQHTRSRSTSRSSAPCHGFHDSSR